MDALSYLFPMHIHERAYIVLGTVNLAQLIQDVCFLKNVQEAMSTGQLPPFKQVTFTVSIEGIN